MPSVRNWTAATESCEGGAKRIAAIDADAVEETGRAAPRQQDAQAEH